MFTGIVEELGQVVALEHSAALEARSARLSVRGPVVVEGTRTGDSISVNGCCLTVSELSDGVFVADVMAETLQRTGLGALAPGSRVNLEVDVMAKYIARYLSRYVPDNVPQSAG